jgi:hypothetical protein
VLGRHGHPSKQNQNQPTMTRSLHYLNRTLLAFSACLLMAAATHAQISVYVLQPEDNMGPLNFTWSETWGADLNNAANTVVSTLALVNDGTAADSLGCNALTNGSEVSNKIAMVYRGTCEFGMKSLRAQTAGALAVVIVNNVSGPPVGMGAGAMGDQITIPVVMVSDLDGAMLRSLLDQGIEVEMRIGTLTGVFPYNLGLENRSILLPKAAGIPAELAQDAEDLSFGLGAWVYNYGSSAQSNVRLQAQVTSNGNTVYDQTSSGQTIPSIDSLWIALPDFALNGYDGLYEVEYTILSDEEDAFTPNDSFSTTMHIGSVFTYAGVNPATGIPVADTYIAPATNPTGWTSCIYFNHPRASRMAATGLHVTLWARPDSVFAGNFISVQANMWNEAVTASTTLPGANGLSEEQYGDHILAEAERGEPIFVPFLEPLVLMDNTNYLFCLISNDDRTWHGYDADLNYEQNMMEYNLPISNIFSSQWFNGFSGFDTHPSIGVAMIDVNTIGMRENSTIDVTPYPNPTNDHIRIPLAGQSGSAVLEIFDLAGTKVAERRVNIGGSEQLVVDMNGISNGAYVFNMVFENGRRANFRVVVSR